MLSPHISNFPCSQMELCTVSSSNLYNPLPPIHLWGPNKNCWSVSSLEKVKIFRKSASREQIQVPSLFQWHPSSAMCVKKGPEQLNPLSRHSLLCTIGKQCLSSALCIPAPTDKWIFCAPGTKCSWHHQKSLNEFTFRQSPHKKTQGPWVWLFFFLHWPLMMMMKLIVERASNKSLSSQIVVD